MAWAWPINSYGAYEVCCLAKLLGDTWGSGGKRHRGFRGLFPILSNLIFLKRKSERGEREGVTPTVEGGEVCFEAWNEVPLMWGTVASHPHAIAPSFSTPRVTHLDISARFLRSLTRVSGTLLLYKICRSKKNPTERKPPIAPPQLLS